MKIKELLSEAKMPKLTGKIKSLSPDVSDPMPTTYVQRSIRNTDPYMQYRYGIAVAAAKAIEQGHLSINDFEQESEFAENIVQIAYTEEEEEIILLASQLMDIKPVRITNKKSRETKSVNKQSPINSKK